MRNCTDLLVEYAALIALYPNQLETHRAFKFQQWLHRLLTNPSVEECRTIAIEFDELFGANRPQLGILGKQALIYATSVHQAVVDARSQLKRAIDRVKMEPDHKRGFEDARNRLRELGRSDKRAGLAVELAVILALCNLNLRFLKCAAVRRTDDGGEGMRLKEGQTLLQEAWMANGLMVELTGLLPSCANEGGDLGVALSTLNKTYAIFKELLVSFVFFS